MTVRANYQGQLYPVLGRKEFALYVRKDDDRVRTPYEGLDLKPATSFAPGFATVTNLVINLNPPASASTKEKPVFFQFDADVTSDEKVRDAYAILPFVVKGSVCTELLSIGSLSPQKTRHVHFDGGDKVDAVGFLHIFTAGSEIASTQVPKPYDPVAYFAGLKSKSQGISAAELCKSKEQYPMKLSLDGNFLACILNRDTHFAAVVYDLTTMKISSETDLGDLHDPIEYLNWVSENQLIYIKKENLYLLDIGTKKVKKLQSHTIRIVTVLPQNPHQVVIVKSDNGTWFVKYDVLEDKVISTYDENENCYLLLTRQGDARVKWYIEHDRFYYFYRPTPTAGWKSLDESVKQAGLHFNIKGDESIDRTAEIHSLSPSGDLLYISTRSSSDKFELAAFNMKEGSIKQVIARHPKYDIGGDEYDISRLLYRKRTGQLIGLVYDEEKPRVVWLDPNFSSAQHLIDLSVPNHTNFPVDYTDDGSTFLFFSSSDKDPGIYYILRPKTGALITVLSKSGYLEGKTLADTLPFDFKARDGATIHAYLTEPVEKSNVPPPLIVDIHGGPAARDIWTFSPSVQFFTSRGYAVLQVNYRGSSGYGAAYQKAGLRARLDTVVIDDVADGVKYLISEHKVDSTRIGVTGGSFGGYSAYMSLIKYPDLYRAGVAIAAVSHWATLEHGGWYDRNFGFTYMRNLAGGEHFSENEKFIDPYLRAREIKQPIYIMHGDFDDTVAPEQAEMMYKALKKTNEHVKYMRFPNSSHQNWGLSDRITLLNEEGDFFAENLKPLTTSSAPSVAQK